MRAAASPHRAAAPRQVRAVSTAAAPQSGKPGEIGDDTVLAVAVFPEG